MENAAEETDGVTVKVEEDGLENVVPDKKAAGRKRKHDALEKAAAKKAARKLLRKEKEEKQLEIDKQIAFDKLQNVLELSKKYSGFLVKELGNLKKKPNVENEVCGTVQVKTEDGQAAAENTEDVTLSESQPKLLTGGQLRSYQLDGFLWLKLMYENGVSCILGDEMGLGKTIQSIAFIAHLIERGIKGPFLICAPLSTLSNWVSEFKRFVPEIPVILFHGIPDVRKSLCKQISRLHFYGSYKSFPVVLTNYTMVLNERLMLQKFDWRVLVIDEGHRIKNIDCQLRDTLVNSYRVDHKILLTGTPFQNNLMELYSLLNFIIPDIFDDLRVFESWFDVAALAEKGGEEAVIAQEQERHIVVSMHEILAPFLLRRTKPEVELNLPLKKEILVYAPQTAKQEQFYQSTVNKTIMQLLGKAKEGEIVSLERWESGRVKRQCCSTVKVEKPEKQFTISLTLQNVMMHFRKICNHPYLVESPLDSETGYHETNENLVDLSGKMQILDCLLKELKGRGHKVLIFSVMVRMIDIIHDYCEIRNWSLCRLDGSTPLDVRCEQIANFNTNPDIFLFLISTRAGGLGVNLTAADTVIIYDSDWNPQVDLQAQDRCHRIGQTKPVVVYRLVTMNSIEERIFARANAKRKLERIIMKDGMFSRGVDKKQRPIDQLTIEELKELLMATDHKETVQSKSGSLFTEEEMNKLMDRSDLYSNLYQVKTESSDDVEGVYKVLSVGN